MKGILSKTQLYTDLKMVKFNSKGFFFLSILVFIYSHSFAQEYYTVNANELTLRKGPGTTYGKIALLPKGQQVILLKKENDEWWKIKVENFEGFVSQKYLKGEPYNNWDK